MTVLEYLNTRSITTSQRRQKIRVYDVETGQGSFDWLKYKDEEVKHIINKPRILVLFI